MLGVGEKNNPDTIRAVEEAVKKAEAERAAEEVKAAKTEGNNPLPDAGEEEIESALSVLDN